MHCQVKGNTPDAQNESSLTYWNEKEKTIREIVQQCKTRLTYGHGVARSDKSPLSVRKELPVRIQPVLPINGCDAMVTSFSGFESQFDFH